MTVERLTLTDFRNHGEVVLAPAGRMTVLTGQNGAGKTNILEALSLLAPGRGIRNAPLREMARQNGPGGFAISADVQGARIGTGTVSAKPDRRIVRINETPAPATALAEHLSISWLTPAMDRLFVDSPGSRRRFLDRLVLALDPTHGVNAARYEAAMRARNALLAEERTPDPDWLSALEARMGEHGRAMDAARADLIDRLAAVIAIAPEAPFARPRLLLDGWRPGGHPLEDMLRDARARDAAAGRATMGPHRSDLSVRHEAKDQAATLCSTGEQKALLLSIMLAHANLVGRTHKRPLLILLDEVTAHLDPDRRLALFDRLHQTGGQVWMTGTESGLFVGARADTQFVIENGHVIA